MSESTNYLVANIEKTFDLSNAIRDMERDLLSKIDSAMRATALKWLDENWIDYKDETLSEDYCINIIHKDWLIQNIDEEVQSYIWTYFQLNGDDPIWGLFGLPDQHGNNSVHIHLWFSNEFKKLKDSEKLISTFDSKNKKILEENGFNKKGGKVNRFYEKKVIINNEFILKGLKEDDWDDAFEQFKTSWEVFNKLDWCFLRGPFKGN